jgi:peptidoglycan/xylan/chitin deacetylase (PgdA/CDA1 family)
MKAMASVKKLLLSPLLLPRFPAFLRHVQRGCATVFMLHRFRDEDRGIAGCDLSHLRRMLDYLRRNNYELVSLLELFERLEGKGPPPRGAVVFTLDDGYVDQAAIAGPVFSKFDCPVTTFVSTGFLDGKLWFWWDQIEHVFEHTACRSVQVRLGDATFHFPMEDERQRVRAQTEFTAACKRLPETQKLRAIAQLAQAADVVVPGSPPPRFAPMSWDQVRTCERMGMTFGPHSVTHPVLSRTSDEAAQYEITESWARLRAEARSPVPVFCYPNGGWDDFGDREMEILRRSDLVGAVVAEPGYAHAPTFRAGANNRFRVQRFGFPDELPHLVQYVSGVERFKQMVRSSA